MALTNAECVARYRARHLAQCRERDRLAARAKRKRLNLIVRGKPLSVVVGNTGTLRRGWTEDRALGGVL